MILGIGTDIASIDRIARVLDRHGAQFAARCFAPEERARAEKGGSPAAAYARRWAAKEACVKALGLGARGDILLRDIAVVNDAAGKPSLRLSGGAQARLAALTPARMTARIDVSLSDEPPLALAFVVISASQESP